MLELPKKLLENIKVYEYIMVIISLNKSLQVIKGCEENVVFYKVPLKGLSALIQFLTAERPLGIMKNAFYFTSTALFRIFSFMSWPFGHVAKWLDRKDKVNFKIIMAQPGYQTIIIHILPNTREVKTIRQWN